MIMSMKQKQSQKDGMNEAGGQPPATTTTIKGNHRKAKSQLNQPNGAPGTAASGY